MLLALVLAACVAPAAHEWVEISQQHYRKPSHTHAYNAGGTFYPADEETRDDLRHTFYPANGDTRPGNNAHIPKDKHDKGSNYDEEIIEQNMPIRVYPNHSIAEHNWNNDRPGNNIKRVDGNAKLRPNITPEFSLEIYGEVTESAPEQATSVYSNRLKDKEIFPAMIEKVPNKGSVKRVQLSNTPVKSPSVENAESSIRRNDIKPHGSTAAHDFSDEFEIKTDIFRNQQNDAVTTINNVKNLFSSTMETPLWKYDRTYSSTSEPGMIFQKYPQTHQFDNIKKMNNNVRDRGNIPNIKNITIVEETQVSSDQINTNAVKPKLEDTKNEDNIKKETTNFVAKHDNTNKIEDIDLEEVTTNTYPKNNTPKVQKTKPSIDLNSKTENIKNEEIKVNTMENVVKFLKVVADTISKNTKRGVNGKVKYLNELKETLLSSIKERIDTTWPDDTRRAARRRARSARGHVKFPSSESSLMTISFLTFAVFLIKLVLQVIQTYKNKTMMVAPLVVATAGRTLRKLRNVP